MFRIEQQRRRALDGIAEAGDRDRSYVLYQAIDAYLETHAWQIEHIKTGLKQAKSGEFSSERVVSRAFAQWRQ